MCNDQATQPDSIELIINVAGHRCRFERELPSVVRSSSGRMSIRAGLEPITISMLHEAIDELLHDAAADLDQTMPHPRLSWWQLDKMAKQRDNDNE